MFLMRSRSLRMIVPFLVGIFSAHPVASREFTEKIWPSGPPDSSAPAAAEIVVSRDIDQNDQGLNRSMSNVGDPTFSVLLPEDDQATGAAVVVLPGGGFSRVVIDKEGLDVGRWLASRGVAAIVVKYRTADIETPENRE